MPKQKVKATSRQLLSHGRRLLESADDHAVAVIGAAMLDEALREAICFVLRGDAALHESILGMEGPLQSFGARIKLGQALGLYGEVTHRNLDLIRKVRNDFAHSVVEENQNRRLEKMSFAFHTVADRCASLKTMGNNPPSDPRARFKMAVTEIFMFLLFADPDSRPVIQVKRQILQ